MKKKLKKKTREKSVLMENLENEKEILKNSKNKHEN
jgi:hypothetical protein